MKEKKCAKSMPKKMKESPKKEPGHVSEKRINDYGKKKK